MAFAIERFSSVLCFAYGTNFEEGYLSEQCFVLTTDNYEYVFNVIYKLGKLFENDLHPVVEKIVELGKTESFDSFVKATLHCCVRISVSPSYFTFALLCSFILEVVTKSFNSEPCFCLAGITSACLIAVYYRCYKDYFRGEERFQSFGSYCRRLNTPLHRWNNISELPVDKGHFGRALLLNARDGDYRDFSLMDFEKKLVTDCLDFLPTESTHTDDEVTTSTSLENSSSMTDVFQAHENELLATQCNLPEDAITTTVASAVNATNVQEDLDSSSDSYEDGGLCPKCRRRCFKYLQAFKMTFSAEINQENNE